MIDHTGLPIIRTERLQKRFGSQIILDGIDLSIPDKCIYTLVGQSGTGKSVLLKTILGMIKPDAGKVWLHDSELTTMKHAELIATRKRFGYAFQYSALFDSMDVGENIAFPLREVLGITDKKVITQKVSRMLEWIELPGIEKKRIDELSGGMKKRIGVARALVMQPEVLFFDEPTTGLDPVLSETIHNLVIRVHKELGITCMLITHDIPAAFKMSDRIAFLDKGKIVAEGTPQDIAASEHEMVRDFIRIAFNKLEV